MNETETPSRISQEAITESMAAGASSAHARVNIPLNLENWKSLDLDIQNDLLWFHQHLLTDNISLKEAGEAIGYEESVVFRVLKGIYGPPHGKGSWDNITAAIRSYKKVAALRSTIQKNEFVENDITRMICAGLSYCLANNTIALIVGESRMGKTATREFWHEKNNHGRTVSVVAPPIGGAKALLRAVAKAIGVNKNLNAMQMAEAIQRGFNKNRILIIDEAHRLLPGDRRSDPVCLEWLRHLHDETKCGLALIATHRFNSELRKLDYQFEQLLGRIGQSVFLPRKIKQADIEPIIRQYIRRPGVRLMEAALQIANEAGRLGILVERLKVASHMANKAKETMIDEHFFKALALNRQMGGEIYTSAK